MLEFNERLVSPLLLFALLLLGVASYFAVRWWEQRIHRHATSLPQGRGLAEEVLAVGGLVLAWVGFFWQPLLSSGVWLPRGGGDFTSFYYPLYSFASRSLHAGHLPLWNPSLYAGMPYVADLQTAALYPPTLLALAFGQFSYGRLELLVIVHYLFASTTMYLFLRQGLRQGRTAAVLGGIAFAYCGFMTAHFGHLPMVPVASWLPLSMLAVTKMLSVERANPQLDPPPQEGRGPNNRPLAAPLRRLRWAAVGGVSLALGVLAGHPQIFFYCALTVAAWAIYLIASNWRLVGDSNRQVILYNLQSLLPTGLIFGLLALPQLLLSNELGGESIRAGIGYQQAATDFSTAPIGLVSLLLPRVWGSNPQNYWGVDTWASTETWAYSGVITLLLAGLAVAGWRKVGRRGVVVFFAGLGLVSLLLTLGGQTVLFGWLFETIPGWNRFRDAGRLLLPFSFALATLAALGVGRLLAWTNSSPTLQRESEGTAKAALSGMSFGLLAAALLLTLLPLPIFLLGVTSGQNLERTIPFVNDTLLLILWLLLSAGLIWYARAARGATVGWLLIALLVVDLFSVNAAFNPGTSDNTLGFQHADAVSFLRNGTDRFQNRGEVFRLDSDTGIGAVWQPSLSARAGFEDSGGIYNPLKPSRYDELWNKARQDRNTALYELFNIKYVVGMTDTRSVVGAGFIADSKLEKVFTSTKGLVLYYNPGALPRAYIVHNSDIQPLADQLFSKLTGPSFNPRKAVLLESGVGLRGTLEGSARYAELSGSNPKTGEGATILGYGPEQPDSLTVSTTLKEEGYLVVSNVYYPGWQATVDGQTATIQRANYAFQAIRLTAGQHTVTLRFVPRLWQAGLVSMAGGTLLALLLLLWPGQWWPLRGRRQSEL